MEIFYTNIDDIAARYDNALSRVPCAFRVRVDSCCDDKKRQAMVAAALLLKHCIGISENKPLQYTAAGKPYLKDGPNFSLSYGGNIAALLIDKDACGVDTEALDGSGRREPAEVLTDVELCWLQDQVHNYMTLWTRKEAALKAYGDMEAAPPASFSAIEHSNSVDINGKRVYIGSCAAGGNVISWAASELAIPALTLLNADELIEE